jgi:hypothetical protein
MGLSQITRPVEPRTAPVDISEASRRRNLVDQLGVLDLKIALGKFDIAAAKQLRAQVESWTKLKPDETQIFQGINYVAHVGMKENRRFITSIDKVFKKIGKSLFLENCSFSLKACEEWIPAIDLPNFIDEARNGPRTVTTVPRVAEPIASAA